MDRNSLIKLWTQAEMFLDNSTEEMLIGEENDDDDNICFSQFTERRNPFKITNYFEGVIPMYSMDDFRSHFRMRRESLEVLLPLLPLTLTIVTKGAIPTINMHGKPPVDCEKEILIAIWCISNQEVYRSVADRFGVSMSTAHLCFKRVCTALVGMNSDLIKWPSGAAILPIFEDFESHSRIQRVIGAIDGCHIPIKCPAVHSSTYVNRKKFHSIVLQAVCDHNRQFTDIYVGWPGSVHDATVLRNSPLAAKANELFPADSHLLGDSAYPLESWLIPPFRDNGHLTDPQKSFNHRHSSARQIIERAFALLKGRWRKLKYIDVNSVESVPRIVTAACVLHSFCLAQSDITEEYPEDTDDQQQVDLMDYQRSGLPNRAAHVKRNLLAGIA